MSTPKAPSYLNPVAKTMWKRHIQFLIERNDYQAVDLHHFEMYCINYAIWQKAIKDIDEKGFSISNSQGTASRNPALSAKADAEKVMVKMSNLLGFDPLSRRKNPVDNTEMDELDALDEAFRSPIIA